jgi:cbb3-type cytochrome oxidase cytochrome c subunit
MQVGLPIKIALVVCVAFLLLGNGFIMYKNYKTEWRQYQKDYLTMAADRAEDPQMKQILKARSPRIEQLVITEFGKKRVDRCLTCHMGVDDQRFVDAPQPYRTHPKIPGNHAYRTFGCTTCHAGNGRGLSAYDAHGKDPFWMEPLLKGDYIQSGCAKCHPTPYLEETPILRKGAELFKTKACYGCHKVEGVSNGKLGVELSTVGTKWHWDYLEESIVKPKANNFESLMPEMDLAEDEVKALVIYLMSLTGENLVEGSVNHYLAIKKWKSQEPLEVPISYDSGKKVFEEKACNACHLINGIGGKIGPDLSVYGLQRTKEWMIQHHLNPRSLISGSLMPDFNYSQSELEALAVYLSAQNELIVDNAAIYLQESVK